MKILGILFRLIYSLFILAALGIYTQAPAGVSIESYSLLITPDALVEMFTTINWVSIAALTLVVLACLRILDMVWNVLFCVSTLLVTVCSLYLAFGPGIALPTPLDANSWVETFCNLPRNYPVPALIVACIFAIGWLIATASLRIAITAILSYVLWYICAEMFHYIVYLWSEAPHPSMPEVLHTLQAAPWIAAAIPGAFFLIYALVMSFFETFISRREDEQEEEAEQAERQKKKQAEQKAHQAKLAAVEQEKKEDKIIDAIPPEAEGLPIGREPKVIIPPAPIKKILPPVVAKKEEPVKEKPKAEEPKKEEPAKEAPAKEEPKPETKPEEPSKEETKQEESKPEEPVKDEPQQTDSKPEEKKD